MEQYESISFTLNYVDNTKKLKKQVEIKDDTKHKKILESIIDNKSDLEKYAVSMSGEDLGGTTIPLESVVTTVKTSGEGGISVNSDYVVVTNEILAPAFNEFMAWKRRKGVSIELVTIEDIKANYTGDNISGINDDAGKLRQFLADAYDSGNGIKYALLGGDNNIVPIRYSHYKENTTDDNYIIPSDLYFSDFDGDWKVDSDILYGEPSDNINYNPEIYVGRVMVTTSKEVNNWTSKILQYELNPGNGNYSYLKRAFYTQADHLQSYITGGQARYIAKKFYSVFNDTLIWSEMYNGVPDYNSAEIPDSPTGRDVISRINNYNYGFISWFAHGAPIGVAVGTKWNNGEKNGIPQNEEHSKWNVATIDNYDALYGYQYAEETDNGLDDLTNIEYPAINYSIACETMPFDDFGTAVGARNMGESYTCMNIGGGPSYIGNTRYGWVGTSYRLFDEFVGIITSGISYNIGVAEATSKQTFGSGYYEKYIKLSHNLIGCPETEMWTAIPSKFTSASVSESGSNVTVNTGGVSGSTICIMSATDNGSSYYQVMPNVSSYTFTSVPKPYLVTITKHNYIPYLKDPDNIYIQNETIYSEKYIYGKYFYAGENVTTSKPQGPAIIKNGSNVVFDAANDVYLEGGFEVEKGGSFEVK
ncbi:MAG: hypothetical protein JW717_01415 [Marinilabiliaceae bacterium]|nr:hypothetical protein [Marinilabiliaceae bacterium]